MYKRHKIGIMFYILVSVIKVNYEHNLTKI